MKIEHARFTIGEISDGYIDSNEDGVVAYGGRLNVRPPY